MTKAGPAASVFGMGKRHVPMPPKQGAGGLRPEQGRGASIGANHSRILKARILEVAVAQFQIARATHMEPA
jgi:hypothetical protein